MTLKLYREKKNEVHTPEEIKEAFDTSFAVCFNCNKGQMDAKRVLLCKICALNPDIMIAKADICVMRSEPVVLRDQILLINKNGSHEVSNEIARLMADSGIISYEFCFFPEKVAGMSICTGSFAPNEKPHIPYKSNIFIDGDKLLLTARHMTKADREKLKNTDNHTV